MKFVILLVLVFVSPHFSLASEAEPPYSSGKAIRETTLKSSMSSYFQNEIGDYVDVPLDYNDLSHGKISIYYYLSAPMDANKPTMIFFQGGPGGSGHMNNQFDELTDWNVVHLDYRGIGFSAPDSFEVLKNTRYFTSELVARDAHEILLHLNVKKVSAYGHSYGTVVATIFANLFPEMTKAVVLEGTVFNGEENLWSAPHRQKFLQKYFDKLPIELKTKILLYSNHPQANPVWFSRMAQRFMYSSNFKESYTKFLEELFSRAEPELLPSISQKFDIELKYSPSPFFSEYFYYQIACKELSLEQPFANFGFKFENEKLVPTDNAEKVKGCKELNISSDLVKTYSSLNYPILVPVTYFQGNEDGATVAPHSVWHYKGVAKKSAQLFIAKKSGHGPMNELLGDKNSVDHQMAISLTKIALSGEIFKSSEFKEFKKDHLSNWVMTSK